MFDTLQSSSIKKTILGLLNLGEYLRASEQEQKAWDNLDKNFCLLKKKLRGCDKSLLRKLDDSIMELVIVTQDDCFQIGFALGHAFASDAQKIYEQLILNN